MGLTAAFHLAKAGRNVTIFEADDRPGGMSASFDFDGTLIERYYHFINLPDQDLFCLLNELGMSSDLHWQPTKMGFFRRDSDGVCRNHRWGNPRALLGLSDIPLLSRLRYGFHAFSCKYIKDLIPLDDISAADWFIKWGGKRRLRHFGASFFEKISRWQIHFQPHGLPPASDAWPIHVKASWKNASATLKAGASVS